MFRKQWEIIFDFLTKMRRLVLLSNLGLPRGEAFSVWRYKENSNRNCTATDITLSVNQLISDEMEKIDGVPVIELYAGYQVTLNAGADDIKENSAVVKGTSDEITVYYTNDSKYEQKRSAGSQNGNLRIFMFIRIIRKTERGSFNQRSGTLR